jgi:hypothetical protein
MDWVQVTDSRFPSGPWTGFFTYRGSPRRHRMDLSLHFAAGAMRGEGSDGVGPFKIAGRYADNGECLWVKGYLGAHNVDYRGFGEGRGIWGTWRIGTDSTGGFHIWPLGQEPAAAEEERATEPALVEALATRH